MRVALSQSDPFVGAFEENVKKIKSAWERADQDGARLLITPELGICGYPLHDLLDRPEIYERNERALDDLVAFSKKRKAWAAVGWVAKNPASIGREALNQMSVLGDGKNLFSQAKALLPTYDVFDEARYFEPARAVDTLDIDGLKCGFAICEDLWGGRLYNFDPAKEHAKRKVELLVSLSASPYEMGKRARREELHQSIAKKVGAPLVYVNQVGATDEILFDGGSFALDASGKFNLRLPSFEQGFGVVELGKPSSLCEMPGELEELRLGLVMGIREYFKRCGFKQAVIGLSGGIDSSVVACLAVEALGRENVRGFSMPSQFSSGHSLEDADQLAKNLGIAFEVRPIKFMYSVLSKEIGEGRGELKSLALENLQARLRGTTLMTLANHYNALTLTTGNKSELATGYCTQYGDMVGAIAPIGDLFKMKVYELAREINRVNDGVIPERVLTKAPSAELKPDQVDQDSLPPYEKLDPLLAEYLEQNVPVGPLVEKHGDWAREILRGLEINEFKRRQAAPVLKVSTKAFGIGRRIPIAKIWDQK